MPLTVEMSHVRDVPPAGVPRRSLVEHVRGTWRRVWMWVDRILAQGDSDRIGGRIIMDGEFKAERITHQVSASTFCVLKAA